jgi:maleate isomerase
MSPRVLIGILTPSSNTRLEPLTTAILAGIPEATAHFARFRVVRISMDPTAMSQFEHEPILAAADQLADARVDVIAWSGTAGGWRGLAADQDLCDQITARTGIPATTSTLALVEALRLTGRTTIGLVTPCPDDMQARIEQTFDRAGFRTVAARNLDISANWELASLGADTFDPLVGAVAAARPDAISTYCTNFDTAHHAPRWEREHGIAVYDSISVAIWKALLLAGVRPARITGWGSLFATPAAG